MAIEQLIQSVLAASPAKRRRLEAVLKGEDALGHEEKPDKRLVTFSGAARMMGLGRSTVYALVKSGRLDAVLMNGRHRLTMQSVNEFLAGRRGIVKM